MKTCKGCGESKPIDEFYAHPKTRDGHQGKCKACKIAYTQGKYERKRPTVPEGQKFCSRCKTVKPLEAFHENVSRTSKRGGPRGRQTYCKVCHLAYQREYSKQPLAKWREGEKKSAHQKTPAGKLRQRARLFTGLAIVFGYLVPKPCEVEGCVEPSHPHHTQYEKPLDGIQWFCTSHHLSVGHGGRWTNPPAT